MKRFLHISALLALAALAGSCVKEPQPDVPDYPRSNVELKAVPVLPDGWLPMTKAVSDITDIDDAGLQARGFGVYAFYTGAEDYSSAKDKSEYRKFGLVLNNRQFSYTSGTWNNTGKAEFWPTASGDNLSLFAYAPWDTWNGVVSYDGKVPSIQYDDFVAQNLSVTELEKQRDILWGTNTAGNPHKNVEKDDYSPEGTVDFHFRHAVAKVHFAVKGSLPVASRTQTGNGTSGTPTYGSITTENGNSSSSESAPVFSIQDNYYTQGTGNNRNYYGRQTITETEEYTQTQYRIRTETVTGARFTVQGQRYMVERVAMKGFYKTGTLLLDNTSAYAPTWINQTKFPGSNPEYVLTSVNVLTQSLQNATPGTIQNNFGTYTGITETATDLMSDYFLYAIPRPSSDGDKIAVTIKYHKLDVEGTSNANFTRQVTEKRTRQIRRTRTKYRDSQTISVSRSGNRPNYTWNYPKNEGAYTFTAEFGEWSGWSAWNNDPEANLDAESGRNGWGAWSDYSYGESTITSENLVSATVGYNSDPVELNGEIITSLLGGRAYTINLIVAGDKMELDVVPRPWDLQELEFDYNANINDVIQALTYDSSFIDYADADGNVYINNRMGKFYFKLGAGKFASWQASLVGDAAFGFTDENGNWILDEHGNRVASIRGAIDPEVMNYIYIKPINTEATVTSHAKLRIYYIDATGDAVVALNLVNMANVTEWTIWQNAN